MSRRNKNNHYHYAEKFDPRSRRMRALDIIKAPKKTFTLAFLFLLAFGLISTTFAAYVSSDDFTDNRGTVIISARNTLAQREGLDGYQELAASGAGIDLASTAAVTDLRYNSDTKGWGTNSSIKGNSSGYIVVSFDTDSDETFKIYHDGWGDAYFSKSVAAVSLGTEYTLNNTNSNPNMTCSFKAGTYGIYITSPDTSNGMKMTIYHLYDGDSYYYLDAGTYWDKDGAVFGACFCNSADGTAAEWVKADPCGDVSNTHIYRVKSPSGAKYKTLVWGRFKDGTTQSQMSFTLTDDGGKLWNQTGDQGYQNPNTVYQITSTGTGTATKATVSISATDHSHTIYAYEAIRDTVNDSYTSALTIKNGEAVACTQANIPAMTASNRSNYHFDGWYRGTTSDPDDAVTLVSDNRVFASGSNATLDKKNYSGTSYYFAKYTLDEMTVTFDGYGDNLDDNKDVIVAYGKKPALADVPDTDASGYTFRYWDNNGTHYDDEDIADTAVTDDITYTAKYTIDAPTVSISGASNNNLDYEANSGNYTIVGVISTDVDTNDSNVSTSGVFAWDSSHSQDQPDNLAYATLNTSTGVFSATMPGVYYLTYTGTVSNSLTINGSADATVAFTVTVKPEVPTFDISLIGKVNDSDLTGATSELAWMVLLGANYHFEASVSNSNSNYTYEWSKNGTDWYTVANIPASWTDEYAKATAANSPNITINTTQNGSKLTFANNRKIVPTLGATQFTLYVRATRNGVSRTASDPVGKWWFIERLIKSYSLRPLHEVTLNAVPTPVTQKIFSTTTIAQAGLEAVYSDRVNYTGYTTYSKASADNLVFTNAQTLNHTSAGQTLNDFTTTMSNFLNHEGVKYLKIKMEKVSDGIEDNSGVIHTTVGTASESAYKPFYFIDGIANDTVSGRLMAFWEDSSADSGYSYQTAQDVYNGVAGKIAGTRYRVNLPSDVTQVVFAVAKTDYYGLPTYNNGSFAFSPDFFTANTNFITINDSTDTFTLTGKTASSVSLMTGTTGAFVPES